MVDACACTASSRTTGRSATSTTWWPARTSSATPSCSAASARGACTPCRSTSPSGCSRPAPTTIAHARRVIEAMGDGTGAVMLDGKMEDDASVKQCQVIVELAEQLAARPRAQGPVRRHHDRGLTRDRPPPPPLRALHAGRQRAGAGEGQDAPGDALIFDLEDAVAPDAKAGARDAACAAVAGRVRPPRAAPSASTASTPSGTPTTWPPPRRRPRRRRRAQGRLRRRRARRRRGDGGRRRPEHTSSGRWSRPRSPCSTPRRSPRPPSGSPCS